MTPDEKLLHDYIDFESSEMALKTIEGVEVGGFCIAGHSTEVVSMKILSMAFVKTLTLMVEKSGHPGIAMAYLQVVPMHVDLIKELTIKELRQRPEHG